MLWKFLQPSLYCSSDTGSHFCCCFNPTQPQTQAQKRRTCIVTTAVFFLSLHLESKRRFKCSSPDGEYADSNICVFRAPVRSYLLNNCHYWCLWHCYSRVRTLQNNKADRRKREREGEKKKIILPVEKAPQRQQSPQQQIRGKNRFKKRAQVSIFIHIQKQVALESKIAHFHFCRDASLCYRTARTPFSSNQLMFHLICREACIKNIKGEREIWVDIALISIS